MIELRHLRLIEAINSKGGVTRAAAALNITQSGLSHQLKGLEQQLGTEIFFRINKRMVLSPAGRHLLAAAHKLIPDLDALEAELKEIGNEEHSLLRISTQCNTSYHWLPLIIQEFRKKYSGIEVELNVVATGNPAAAVLEGKLDIGFINRPVHEKKLKTFPLFADEMVAIMPPHHPLSGHRYLSARDFQDENLIFRKLLIPAGIRPKKISQVMLTEAIIEMVKAGLGISVLSRWIVDRHLHTGELKGVRVTKNGMFRNWSAVVLNRPEIPAHYLEFIRLVGSKSLPSRMKRT